MQQTVVNERTSGDSRETTSESSDDGYSDRATTCLLLVTCQFTSTRWVQELLHT